MREIQKIMSKHSTVFLFALIAACVPQFSSAASSVRVLGNTSSASGTTAAPVRNVNGLSTTRKATLPLKTKQVSSLPAVKSTTTNGNTDSIVDANRLSVIKNLKLKSPVGAQTTGGTTSGGAMADIANQINNQNLSAEALNDLMNKIDELDNSLGSDLDTLGIQVTSINNALTDAIDELDDGLNSRIDERVENAMTGTDFAGPLGQNRARIEALESQVAALESQITALESAVADMSSDVATASDWDSSILTGDQYAQPLCTPGESGCPGLNTGI